MVKKLMLVSLITVAMSATPPDYVGGESMARTNQYDDELTVPEKVINDLKSAGVNLGSSLWNGAKWADDVLRNYFHHDDKENDVESFVAVPVDISKQGNNITDQSEKAIDDQHYGLLKITWLSKEKAMYFGAGAVALLAVGGVVYVVYEQYKNTYVMRKFSAAVRRNKTIVATVGAGAVALGGALAYYFMAPSSTVNTVQSQSA